MGTLIDHGMLYLGDEVVKKVYLGSQCVYEYIDESEATVGYFTFNISPATAATRVSIMVFDGPAMATRIYPISGTTFSADMGTSIYYVVQPSYNVAGNPEYNTVTGQFTIQQATKNVNVTMTTIKFSGFFFANTPSSQTISWRELPNGSWSTPYGASHVTYIENITSGNSIQWQSSADGYSDGSGTYTPTTQSFSYNINLTSVPTYTYTITTPQPTLTVVMDGDTKTSNSTANGQYSVTTTATSIDWAVYYGSEQEALRNGTLTTDSPSTSITLSFSYRVVTTQAGCTVVIDGSTKTSNSTANATYNVISTAMSATWSVSKSGYSTQSGTLVPGNSITSVTLTNVPTYTYTVKTSQAGCVVIMDGVTKTSNSTANEEYTVTTTATSINYSVTRGGAQLSNTLTSSSPYILVTLYWTYSITTTQAGCTVVMDGSTKTTNSTANQSYTVTTDATSISYSVSKTGYNTQSGTMTPEDHTYTITLTNVPTYTYTVTTKQAGCTVKIGGSTRTTNSSVNGQYTVNVTDTSISYEVTRGDATESGTLTSSSPSTSVTLTFTYRITPTQAGCTVVINGSTKTSNSTANYNYEGTSTATSVSYSVSKSGYITETDTLTPENWYKTVTLTANPTYTYTITTTQAGCTVEMGGQTITASSVANASYQVTTTATSLSWNVSRDAFLDYGTLTSSSPSLTVTLYFEYRLTTTQAGCTVVIGGTTFTTNSTANEVYSLINTSLTSVSYSVSKSGYSTASGTFTPENAVKTITLSQLEYTYAITTTQAGCAVVIDGVTKTTNSTANATYNVTSTATSVSYSVSKSGYVTETGTLTAPNVSKTVTLEEEEGYTYTITTTHDVDSVTINGVDATLVGTRTYSRTLPFTGVSYQVSNPGYITENGTLTSSAPTKSVTLAQDCSKKYLTFKFAGSGNFSLYRNSTLAPTMGLEYRKVGETSWTAFSSNTKANATRISVSSGDEIELRGTNTRFATGSSAFNYFSATTNYEVYGNIMSIVNATSFSTTTIDISTTYFFTKLFSGSTTLTSAKDLVLPSKSLTGTYAYYYMFARCTNLTRGPIINATAYTGNSCSYMFAYCNKLKDVTNLFGTYTVPASMPANVMSYMFAGCTGLTHGPYMLRASAMTGNAAYRYMFSGCTSLAIAPRIFALNATTSACQGMFIGCTSLVDAPQIDTSAATGTYAFNQMFSGCTALKNVQSEFALRTLAGNCCNRMFAVCPSLKIAPTLPATTLAANCYQYMFCGCTALVTVQSALPATTLNNYCYNSMFQGCFNLQKAPNLPALTATNYCYHSMFDHCHSLTTPSRISATTMATSACVYMFRSCTALTFSPQLKTVTLTGGCYHNMFSGCTNLEYISALFTTTPSNTYTQNWVQGVKATGSFNRGPNPTWDVKATNGCPTGWTYDSSSISEDAWFASHSV